MINNPGPGASNLQSGFVPVKASDPAAPRQGAKKAAEPVPLPSLWVVVGLGNPGLQYAGNRHNIGQMVIAELARRMGSRLGSHKSRAMVAQGKLATPGAWQAPTVVLANPTCYMNESGSQVKPLLKFFDCPPAQLLVLHDELDIDLGQIRVKWAGGEAGHNGLRSISSSVGTRDYARLRLGIGRPPGRMPVADFVLRDFSAQERTDVEFMISEGADAVETVVQRGLEQARNIINAP